MQTHLSYLMGGEAIGDSDLEALGIEIVEKTESGHRKLKIPEAALARYIELVKANLTKGFWNEIIGPTKILFIFKFKDGRIEEYSLSPENEQKIDTLCAEFNNEPQEKTANVYKYISDNDFYRDFMFEHYTDMIQRSPGDIEAARTGGGKIETVIFGGGCFWCTEAVFKMIKGVIAVTSGYAGGKSKNPSYEEVVWENTGHAEVVKIDFDPKAISFRDLLTVFFGSHDPTSVNRQGHDVGTQYRSIILYTTEKQKDEAKAFIRELNDSHPDGKMIVTQVAPLEGFYPAEEYHRNYYETHKGNTYCELVINPKLEKVQKEFAKFLKTQQQA